MTEHIPDVSRERRDVSVVKSQPSSDSCRTLHRLSPLRSNPTGVPKNTILARSRPEELLAISKLLEPVVLKRDTVLHDAKRFDHVYFMETGLVSLRVVAAGSILETAVIGRHGVVGASFLIGAHLATHQSVVLLPGTAHRIGVADLWRIVGEHPGLRDRLLCYVQALNLHCAQTGLCGIRHNREERLACWLCLAGDALDADVLPVTHDYISSVLGLRRPGVTETLLRFEQQGLIRKSRGVLQLPERQRLEKKACGCYKLIASAYASPVRPMFIPPY
ncbi:Crp/Fnr family transcriptional regulator [Bradyrhizobium oligotrophicum]|uniref:Crp/Fnr family transcriptional regulator n=1 Tax=Bradyrhizobium oligotrophicum TaxID=44255 RepID=UPI003EC0839C